MFSFKFQNEQYQFDAQAGWDLSIPLREIPEQVNCFWAPPVSYEPFVAGDFVGSIAKGAPVNFFNVRFNPHGNGTHTECVGHISRERFVLHECLQKYHFFAKLISLYPQKTESGDRVILLEQIKAALKPGEAEALILRTLPNDDFKKITRYSGSNPPYMHHAVASYLVECGIQHVLLDLPSVDREEDDGKLLAHKAFWNYPEAPRTHCTITELIYVAPEIPDGFYLLNLQTASFDLDASPSKPVIYPLEQM